MGYFNHAWALVHTVSDEAGDKFTDATILLQGGGRANDDDEDEDDADNDDLDLEPASQHKGAGMKRLANVDGSAQGSDKLSVRELSEDGLEPPKVVKKKAKASSESPEVIEKAASNKADAAAKKSKVNSKTKAKEGAGMKRSTNKDEDVDGSAQGSDGLQVVQGQL